MEMCYISISFTVQLSARTGSHHNINIINTYATKIRMHVCLYMYGTENVKLLLEQMGSFPLFGNLFINNHCKSLVIC